MRTVDVTTIGDATAVILPKELLERLQIGGEGRLYAVETPQGVELVPYDPELAAQLEVAEAVMAEDVEALAKLAGRRG
jgi:bifunctional DNA-binding transcriptional regulator/antitoxin component of YhaV-PrlF toxin-antitoxin module